MAFGVAYALVSWKRKQGGHSHSHEPDHATHASSSAEKPVVGWGAWIVAIVGIAPCFTLIPVLLASIPYGVATTFWVMLSYAISTIGMMVVLTSIALKAVEYASRLEKVERHLEMLAGLVIFVVGIWLILEVVLNL
jgi:ABC-type nickel/cobalt efflux system permease component RcnA